MQVQHFMYFTRLCTLLTFWVYTPLLYQNLTFCTKLHHSNRGRHQFSHRKQILFFFFFFFFTIFCLFFILVIKQSLHNEFGSRIWSKMFFTSAGLKTDVTLVQALRLVILDFYREFLLQWSAYVSWCNNLTIKAWCGGSHTYKNNC